ncbi:MULTISPECIES: MlaE family ABC transporter permease [unclassified Rhodococcus (in: high G+C Gram-positive bacteria)]|uniref:MlaE family ABC transporter permease n=1 Tax=unclassified Rhodococcus (in: high G+C Gram-positive bacteria) TaxID=192944 RepID=UPI00146DD757|nr:ABC transporter permease [Rhodococcus sp. (in: high G+C Gram-positive bacteria)]NMD97524.1 ABC transporter permease [Rhodococcus sp. BL-253-APC-6A1W]
MASRYVPRGTRPFVVAGRAQARSIQRLGHMVVFLLRAVAAVPVTLRHYRKEFLRILSDVTWGNGSLVVGGGTAGVIIVLGASAGAIVAIEGYNALHLLGLEPATGMVASTATTRELAPIMASLAFAAQAGCRFTAQLGAMRISEEIDAMESLAIRSIPYLVTTRLLASVVAVVPLYLVCLTVNYVAVQAVIGFTGGVSSGTYEHYFALVLSGTDIFYSLLKTIVFVIITTTIQCYYGFYASGGPQGVGTAAGRAMRASISAMIVVNLLMTVALWGIGSGARLGG